jgi:hypothetical protein
LGQRQLPQGHVRHGSDLGRWRRERSCDVYAPTTPAFSTLSLHSDHRSQEPYVGLEMEWSDQRKFMRPLDPAALAQVSSPWPSEEPAVSTRWAAGEPNAAVVPALTVLRSSLNPALGSLSNGVG